MYRHVQKHSKWKDGWVTNLEGAEYLQTLNLIHNFWGLVVYGGWLFGADFKAISDQKIVVIMVLIPVLIIILNSYYYRKKKGMEFVDKFSSSSSFRKLNILFWIYIVFSVLMFIGQYAIFVYKSSEGLPWSVD